jgi:hypothetical protein
MSQISIAATLEIAPLSPIFPMFFRPRHEILGRLFAKKKAPKAKLSPVAILA